MNAKGDGFLEIMLAAGAAVFFFVAIGIPVADAYRLQAQAALLKAQADADIAAANLVLSRGLSTVATANAMTPVLLLLAVIAVALAVISLAVVAIVYLRRRYPRQWRTIEAPPTPRVVIGERQPALTEEPAALFLVPRERQRLEVRR